MNIHIGDELASDTGTRFQILKELGKGGQGTVYHVKTTDGRELALKWYHKTECDNNYGLKDRLRELVRRGPPSPQFVWPLSTVSDWETGRFGYLMELTGANYCTVPDLMWGRKETTLRQMLLLAFDIAYGFEKLHSLGLCYRDVSTGNVLIDTENGQALIVDNDNVQVAGESSQRIIHTLQFAAPEIALGQKDPNAYSDLHSVAVLLFMLLLKHHPLEGKRERNIFMATRQDYLDLYQINPVYIFHPHDKSNGPVDGDHDQVIMYARDIYPRELMELFERAFTEGIFFPEKRVRLTEWKKTLIDLNDRIVVCQKCNSHGFLGANLSEKKCWYCGENLPQSPSMLWNDGRTNRRLVLSLDSQIHGFHLDGKTAGMQRDFRNPLFSVVTHPNHPQRLGLKNQTGESIRIKSADGQEAIINAGRNFLLVSNMSIYFGELQFAIV